MTEPGFVDVLVEEHDALPEGCSMRFKRIGEPRAVRRVLYEGDGFATSVPCTVASARSDGTSGPAWAVPVEDSSAGVSTLVYGGDWGLRIRAEDDGAPQRVIAESYLLLAGEMILGDSPLE